MEGWTRLSAAIALSAMTVAISPDWQAAAPGGAEFGDPEYPMRVAWIGSEILVRVYPRPNEGYIQLAGRVMADPSGYQGIVAYNGHRPVRLGHPVAFPLAALKPRLRGHALRALYPDDTWGERGWVHRVVHPAENLIQLTEAYTGSKRRFLALARYNGLENPDLLRIGMTITVPVAWISEELELRPMGVKPPLGLQKDPRTGRHYALYQLQRDETLYSSVILRFTDRERAGEVRRLAQQLMRLNGISSPERVPTHRPLRIPIEWISDEYLADGHARRIAPPRKPLPKRPPKRPAIGRPIHVIIDPGHGGVDAGATYGSRRRGDMIYEDEVVYDIALRLAERLKAQGHFVYFTLRDPNQQRPVDHLAQAHDSDEYILVTPRYHIDSGKIGVNMRVYRIESLFRRLTGAQGVRPNDIVLVSIHGDALAPTLRGAMAYYPDKRLRYKEFRPHGRAYRLRKEAVPSLIRFRPAANKTAADLSESFARRLVGALQEQGLKVASRKPVRGYYYRDGERTLPAVLRYSRVPTSVLVEVANLNNPADRRAIRNSATRDRIARGIASAINHLPIGPGALTAQAAR